MDEYELETTLPTETVTAEQSIFIQCPEGFITIIFTDHDAELGKYSLSEDLGFLNLCSTLTYTVLEPICGICTLVTDSGDGTITRSTPLEFCDEDLEEKQNAYSKGSPQEGQNLYPSPLSNSCPFEHLLTCFSV